MSSYPPPPPPPPLPPTPTPAPPPPLSSMGQTNVGTGVQVMDLTAESQASKAAHDAMVNQLALQKRAASLATVPTLPSDVRQALRQMGLPVRLFGEGLADIRQRLRLAMAAQELQDPLQQQQRPPAGSGADQLEEDEEEEQVTKYTRASVELIEARQEIARFSLDRAKLRLERERNLRAMALAERKQKKRKANATYDEEDDQTMKQEKEDENENELHLLNNRCTRSFQRLKQTALEGSQYGDARALSSICAGTIGNQTIAVTGSWSASLHIWKIPSLVPAGNAKLCHEDRIMAMDLLCQNQSALVATASIDKTAKIYQIKFSADVVMADEDQNTDTNDVDAFSVDECFHLKGHEARLCRTAFHPMQRHVATTSLDHTWRLWDVETGQNLLLQDGHAAPVFGLGFHPDGSVCATSDFASVVQLWDLRTGKSIHLTAAAHAKRVLCAQFSPNGFHWATAGDDGTIQVWDLRRRGKKVVSIPAHSKLISKLVYDDEYLASSSFDGTVRLWSTRTDWKCLNTLRGHEGQVSGVDLVPGGIVTCGFDKTIKYWS